MIFSKTVKAAASDTIPQGHPRTMPSGSAHNASASNECNPKTPSHDQAPSTKKESQRFIKNSRYFTICIYGLVMIIVSAIIFKAIIDFETTKAWIGQILGMLSPFIFGALLAYILNPMVHMFYRMIGHLTEKAGFKLKHTLHTVLAILLTYLIVFGFVVIILLYVVPELVQNIIDFVNYIPVAYASLLKMLNSLQTRFPEVDIAAITKPLTDTVPDLITTLRDMAANMVPAIYSVSMSIASWIVNVLITIIVSIYMLYDKRRLMHSCWRMIYAFLPEKRIPLCREILAECNRLFSSFVIGKSIDSVIIGILCFILMTIFRMDYAPLISLVVGVTNMIPYFGPFIGAIPGILILLFIKPIQAFAFAILILCLQQFDGLILGPKILGDSTGMKPLWIIFAITVGGYVAGVVGMFLGVPVVAFLAYLIDRYLQYRLEKKHIPESAIDEPLRNLELDD
ncbi:MAG: AI-2E family transporter [Lachnospiraceae bacterium]|nr:AI-2E family transporter [Lachnospiraceae bacterium]